MREILFKAKRIDNGEWVEGNIILSNDAEEGWETIIIPTADSNMFVQGNEELVFEAWHRVDKDTICQYTGLKDKNGNKIWENDILRYSYDYENSPWLKAKGLTNEDIKYSIGAVFWQEWRALWAVCGKGISKSCNQDVYKYSRNPNRTEVIGNIFDNPELVERN